MEFHALKALRALKGLSQEQLGEELGFNKMKVYRWEKDVYKIPFGEIKMICDYFGVTPNDIIDNGRVDIFKPTNNRMKKVTR